MNREQMQNDALESMRTGREGYGYERHTSCNAITIMKGKVIAIYDLSFRIDGGEKTQKMVSFSFINPTSPKAPTKGNILLVKMKSSKNWRLVFSLGKIRDGQIMACEDSDLTNPYYWDEWKDVFIMQTARSRRI